MVVDFFQCTADGFHVMDADIVATACQHEHYAQRN